MTPNSTWVPDEGPQPLFSERCWLQGVIVSVIAYGVNLPLYFLSFYLLIQDRDHVGLRHRLPLLIYIVVSFLLGTLYMITAAAFTQMAFINDRNYPGGPSAFESGMFSIPVNKAGNAAFVLSIWLSDALVVWRFKVIFQRCHFPMWVVMFFPYLMFAGSIATGIMCLIQDSATNPYISNNINFTIPYSLTQHHPHRFHRSPFDAPQVYHRFCDGTTLWKTLGVLAVLEPDTDYRYIVDHLPCGKWEMMDGGDCYMLRGSSETKAF